MKKLVILFSIIIFMINVNITNANIDLVVSPIRYEIQVDPWETIQKTAKLINKSDITYKIETWASDFESKDQYWNPSFVRVNELDNQNQWLASWINIDNPWFIIEPNQEVEIVFDINIPQNATPWWHYAWVFFKTVWSNNSLWSNLQIKVDYWVLILLNVSWEIIDNTSVWEPLINIQNSEITLLDQNWEIQNNRKKDICKFIDFTSSDTDWKCFDTEYFNNIASTIINKFKGENKYIEQEEENNSEETIFKTWSLKNDDNFYIEIDIPFQNEGNTHVKPEWKIILKDEDWNEIKWIWKEIIKDDNWMITWEKIVDYLPINDQWGNVLPNTKRIYKSEWNGFPYENYDEEWKKTISYWTPWEYYTNKNISNLWPIFPWQRVNEKLEQKTISALINLWYYNYEWENIEFNSAEKFEVDYKVKYIWINPYFFLFWWIVIIFLIFFWIIIRKITRKKCETCKKTIKKDMKICPYCWAK